MLRSIRMELPSLAKEGWLRPLRKSGEASLAGADGVVRSSHPLSEVERTTPSALFKGTGPITSWRGHPSFAKEGSSIRLLRDISGSLCFHQPDCFACPGQEV